MRRAWFAAGVAGLAGVLHLGVGLWAFLAPASFYQIVATFPPYNQHFLHDVGAFLVGIGAALLAALVWRDALFVALLAGTVAAALHWISHLRDHQLGGSATDPWTLGAFALLLLVALVARFPARSGAQAGEAGRTSRSKEALK